MLVMLMLAYLMVSKVPYLGFKSLNISNRQPFEILVATVLVSCLLYLLYRDFDLVLFIGIWSYILVGVIFRIVGRLRRPAGLHEHKPALAGGAADDDADEE